MGLRLDDAGNAWAFPAASQEEGLGAMMALAGEVRAVTAACDEQGHPIDLFRALEPEYLRVAEDLSTRRKLPVPIPKLCTLVVASAFDAAIHDAYGKAFGVSCYETYGPRFMTRDLSSDLGPRFAGEYLDRYVPSAPRALMPVFHWSGQATFSRPLTFASGSRTACPTRSRNGSHATD